MITLSKRVMAPRNILMNLVEGDTSLLIKARDFFMLACYPVVGYKQIARFIGEDIQYEQPEVIKHIADFFGGEDETAVEEVTTVEPQDNTVYFDADGKALHVCPQPFSRWSQADKIAYYTKKTIIDAEQKQLPPEERAGATLTKEELAERMSKILGRKITITKHQEVSQQPVSRQVIRYDAFYVELTKRLREVPKRSKEDVQAIMKELYNLYKENLESKESVRKLIIDLSNNFDHYADYIKSNSKFIPMHKFINECADMLYKQNMGEDDLPF